MRRIAFYIIAIAMLFTLAFAFAETELKTASIGDKLEFDNVAVKLIEYHIETIDKNDYLYLQFEFINYRQSKVMFEKDVAWITPSQNGEQLLMHTIENMPRIYMNEICDSYGMAFYSNAYKLIDLTSDVVVEMIPSSQIQIMPNMRQGIQYLQLNISKSQKVIANGMEMESYYAYNQ